MTGVDETTESRTLSVYLIMLDGISNPQRVYRRERGTFGVLFDRVESPFIKIIKILI